MSTVAIKIEDDYVTMAGDRQVHMGSWGSHSLTKVFRIRDHLLGIVGDMGRGLACVQWYRDGAKIEDFPYDRMKDGDFAILVWNGTDIVTLDEQGYYTPVEEMEAAVGSGAMAALGAMEMGAGVQRAIEVASMIDEHSGRGSDVVRVKL